MQVVRSSAEFSLTRGHTYFAPAMSPSAMIIDAGAHRLEFAMIMHRRFGCSVIALEPNASLLATPHASGVRVLVAALASRDGPVSFTIDENPEASTIVPLESAPAEGWYIEAFSLETVMKQAGRPMIDLLKLDVEGAEFGVLLETDENVIKRFKQITVEFHDFLPRFSGLGLVNQVRRRMRQLGFLGIRSSVRTNGDVLFLNRSEFDIGSRVRALLPWTLPVRRKQLEGIELTELRQG